MQEPTPEKAQPVEQQFRDPAPVTGFLRPPVAKAQVNEVPGGEALAHSGQWKQSYFPWDQDAPLEIEFQERSRG